MNTPEQRLRFAVSILNFEARRDGNGHLAVYHLPPEDGGGTYEVAGINEKYHPVEAARLAALIAAGQFDKAEQEAIEIIATFTDVVARWSDVAAIECYLRDCAFNRGPRGAARILQRAVGVDDDGDMGPLTKAAIANRQNDPASLLEQLRANRERYERDVVHRDERSIFWKGLVNRWNNAVEFARSFLGAVPGSATLAAAPPPHVHAEEQTVCDMCGPGIEAQRKPTVDRWEPTTHQSSRGGTTIDHIVIHYTTSRNIDGTISWFKTGNPRTSAHYIVGQDGTLVQMVKDDDRAWHAGSSGMNARSIGIEHSAAPGDQITPVQARTSAALIAWLMDEYNIPKKSVIPHCCVHDTSCCGELFKNFGGKGSSDCAEQTTALHQWMSSMGLN